MPGFGSGTFGSAPFGEAMWAEKTLWLDIPEPVRIRDENAEGFLRNFVDSIKPSVDGARIAARDVFDNVDAMRARTRYDQRVEIQIVAQTIQDGYVILEVRGADAALIEPAGKGWVLESEDVDFRTWTIARVYKQLTHSSYVTPTKPVLIVKGKSKLFSTLPVKVWLRPQAVLPFLGTNYGVEVDEYEPDAFQRSSVWNHDQWYGIKGHRSAYEALGKISGFAVQVSHLWRIRCEMEGVVPTIDPSTGETIKWEVPPGSGKWYTSRVPVRPVYDEICADEVNGINLRADLFCWEKEFRPPANGPMRYGAVLMAAVGFSTPYEGWELTIGGCDMSGVSWPGGWFIEDSGGVKFFLEGIPVYLGGGIWKVRVSKGFTVYPPVPVTMVFTPPVPGGVLVDYDCELWKSCCYCGTNKIRVEVSYLSYVTLEPRERVGALDRLIRKLGQVIPAHVQLAQLAVRTDLEASFGLKAYLATHGISSLTAGFRYLYDVVEADAVETDLYLLTATLTS